MAADEIDGGNPGEVDDQDSQESATSSDSDSSKRSDSGVDPPPSSRANEESSSAAQDPATKEDAHMTERQRSKRPVELAAAEEASRKQSLELAAAERLTKANTKRNTGKKKRSMSAGSPAAVHGSGDTHRRRSFTGPLKSLANLFRPQRGPQIESSAQANSQGGVRPSSRRYTEPTVYFKKEVRVREVDVRPGGDPPADLPSSPVFEEELREEGVILDEAGRQAAQLKKGQRAYAADFERRMAASRRSSSSSQGRASSPGVPPAVIAAVDEMERLHLSRGNLPTNRERRASVQAEPSSEQSSVEEEIVSLPESDQASEEPTDRDTSAAQTGEASEEVSTIHVDGPSHTQDGQTFESSSQANSGPSLQDRGAAQSSSVNQENVPPSVHTVVSDNKSKAPDDQAPQNYVVRAQFEIIYDQDPGLAIQSLSQPPKLLSSHFSPRKSDLHACSAETYSSGKTTDRTTHASTPGEAAPEQSEQHEQSNEGGCVAKQRSRFSGFLKCIAHCLDECGDHFFPGPSDVAPLSDAQCLVECPIHPQPDSVTESSSPALSILDDGGWTDDIHASAREEVKEGSKPTVPAIGFPAGHFVAEDLEHNNEDPCPIDALYDPSENRGPVSYTPSISDLGMGGASSQAVMDNEDFGATLEAAYNTSCSVQAPFACPETLTPLNAVRRSLTQPVDSQGINPGDTAIPSVPMGVVDCDTGSKLLRLQSWLYPSSQPTLEAEHEGVRLRESLILEEVTPSTISSSSDLATGSRLPFDTSSCPTLECSHSETREMSNASLLSILPFHADSDSRESPASLPQASNRPASISRASSQCSINTALNCPWVVTGQNINDSAGSFIASEKVILKDYDGSDSKLVVVGGKSPFQAPLLSPDPSEATLLGSLDSLSSKRSGSGSTSSSGLSIITTFTSRSKGSAKSKTSDRSSSSSGSSGSSSISFGLDGKKQSWTPRVSKAQASVGTTKELTGFHVLSRTDAAKDSPIICSAPNARAITKFVLKHATTQPVRFAKKRDLHRIGEKKTPLEPLWQDEEMIDGEDVRFEVFDVPEEAEERPFDGIDGVEVSATEHDLASTKDSEGSGDVD